MEIFVGISLEVFMAVGIQIVVYWLVTWYSLVDGKRLWRNAKAPLTMKIVTASSLKMLVFTYKLTQHHNPKYYGLKLSLEFNMQRCSIVRPVH